MKALSSNVEGSEGSSTRREMAPAGKLLSIWKEPLAFPFASEMLFPTVSVVPDHLSVATYSEFGGSCAVQL